MYLFKAPILAFAFLLLLVIPESSFALDCSASMGKIRGCRSGVACNQKNKRTGADLWTCQDVGTAPKPAAESSTVDSSASSTAPKKSTESTTKKSTKPKTDSSSESNATKERPESGGLSAEQEEVTSSKGFGSLLDTNRCGADAFLVVTKTPNANSDAVGDFGGMSVSSSGTYQFCRKNGVTQAEADAANKKNSSGKETCKSLSGTEFIQNGARFCRYADNVIGKPMVCGVDDDGHIEECNAEEEAKVAEGGSCEQRFTEARDACFKQADKASTDCDQENQGIQNAMDATKAVGAGAAVSVKIACSKLGEISKIANTSLSGWKTFCAYSQRGCETACSDAKIMYNDPQCIPKDNRGRYATEMTTVEQNVTVCMEYKKSISEAAQHAAAAAVQMQASKNCETDTSALTTANVDECQKNPNNPLCTDAQKCSNAAFAVSNKVCQCINNPSSKDCIANNSQAGSRGVAGATIPGVGSGSNTDPAAAFIPPTSGSGNDTLATSLRDGAVKNEQNLGGAKGNAGLGGGGSGGPGGGGGPGSGSASAGGGAGEDKLKINSGFYGGGTTGGGYLGKAGGAYGSGRPSSGGVNYNKLGAGGAQFDPRRYIAGLNGKAGEYINGPNMDIFRIVKNRIESKKPTMLDPDFKK